LSREKAIVAHALLGTPQAAADSVTGFCKVT
jgi:hypothetical protein